ncbi:MAG: L,D-transpeptidase [Candidatus Gracilibacteria bacterium]
MKKTPDKHHYSTEYPKVDIKKKIFEKGGAVMPYAVHIDGKEWIHGSDGTINGNLASHGCIRTPLFYVKEIHEKVKELGIENVLIDTTGIYS